MTSAGGGGGTNSGSKPARGGRQARNQSPVPRKNSSSSEKEEDPILQSIASKTSVMVNPQVTLTCYIPSQSVGAVIGRRGSTIAQIQRQHYGTVRVSIVGHDDETDNIPYTFSELDWSSPEWTPVVLRGDPCAVFSAAQRLLDYSGEFDDVILDIPISRSKHATVVGKRGVSIANLSADTNVRIFVPQRGLRQDVVQLEGELDNVKTCLEKILTLLVSSMPKKKSLDEVSTLAMPNLPSQTKLRTVARKTETSIQKKKQEDDTWILTISGAQTENVQTAINLLEKWKEENPDAKTPNPRRARTRRGRKGGNKGTAPSSAAAVSPTTATPAEQPAAASNQ